MCTPGYANSIKDLREGLLFIPSLLASWLLLASSRFILAYTATLEDVTIFTLATYSIQLFDLVLLLPVQHLYIPRLFKKYKESQNILLVEYTNKKNMIVLSTALTALLVILYFALPIFKNIIPSLYNIILNSLIACIGCIFLLCSHFLSALPHYSKNDSYITISWTITSVIQLILSSILSTYFGAHGAVLGLTIAYGIHCLITALCNYRIVTQLTYKPMRVT